MCFSALYMHELHRKYHHGDYIDLDNVKEENDEEANGNKGPRQPLLDNDQQDDGSQDELDNLNDNTLNSYHQQSKASVTLKL